MIKIIFVSWEENYFHDIFFTHFPKTTAPQHVIFSGKLSTIIIFKLCTFSVNLWTLCFFVLQKLPFNSRHQSVFKFVLIDYQTCTFPLTGMVFFNAAQNSQVWKWSGESPIQLSLYTWLYISIAQPCQFSIMQMVHCTLLLNCFARTNWVWQKNLWMD